MAKVLLMNEKVEVMLGLVTWRSAARGKCFWGVHGKEFKGATELVFL